MTADAWYLPTCPPWCDRTHGGILTSDGDPACNDSPETQPYVCHSRTLDAAGHGLSVQLVQWEAHHNAQPVDAGPRLVLTLPTHHDDEGTKPSTVTAWARILDAAVREAATLAGGERP